MKAVFIASVIAILFAVCLADDLQRKPPKIPALACNLCQNVIGKIEAAASSNVTSAWLYAQITKVCNQYNIADFCAKNILPQVSVLLPWIQKKATPDKVCVFTRLCKNSTKPAPPVMFDIEIEEDEKRDVDAKKNKTGKGKNPFHGLGINCAACENVVAGLEKVVSSNETIAKFTADLTSVCSLLGINNWCNTNLKPKLIALLPKIKAKTDPTTLCKSIKLCRNETRPPKPPKPSKPPKARMDFADSTLDTQFSVTCEVCQAVVGYAKDQAGSNLTQAAIQKALNAACNAIPFAKDLCTTVLAPFVTNIINGIIAKQDPLQICEKIQLCKDSDLSAEEKVAVDADMTMVKLDTEAKVKCDVCNAILTYVKNQIGSNNSKAAIQKAITNACARIPFAKPFCPVADQYITQIVEGIVAKQNPAAICQKIKLCKPSIVEEEEMIDEDDEDDFEAEEEVMDTLAEKREATLKIECGICQAVLAYVKNVVGSNTANNVVKKALDDACGKIPFAKNMCQSVIAPYVQQIIDGVVAKQDPQAICSKIKLCK